MSIEVAVVKVGGSLLDRRDLGPAIEVWIAEQLAHQPQQHLVLLVGGGRLVDALRSIADVHALDDEAAHWQAIELMQITGRLLASQLPHVEVADSFPKLRARLAECGSTLLLPQEFLERHEPALAGVKLVASWEVTSDSIAARLAICLRASELWLLKSRPASLAECNDWQEAARQGLVDRYFPRLAESLPAVLVQTLPSVSTTGHRT